MQENRKHEEAIFHDKVRSDDLKKDSQKHKYLTSNLKFYSITKRSDDFLNNFLIKNCENKKTLDYCCGEGKNSFFLAENKAEVYGIDISPVSIENSKKEAEKRRLKNANFLVMDAEKLEFEDNFFDLIICSGVLHHLKIEKAYQELSRVLKPDGKIICDEPLAYNPIFHIYRLLTPQLRTKWEVRHILKRKDIMLGKKYFEKIEMRFFHLFTLLAVPFRNIPIIFKPLLGLLGFIDSIILSLPLINWWAWQVIFVLSNPKKDAREKEKRN